MNLDIWLMVTICKYDYNLYGNFSVEIQSWWTSNISNNRFIKYDTDWKFIEQCTKSNINASNYFTLLCSSLLLLNAWWCSFNIFMNLVYFLWTKSELFSKLLYG